VPEYSDDEWAASAGHRPLRNVPREDLLLLHRAFMWAELQKAHADQEIDRLNGANLLDHAVPVSVLYSHLFAWYSFLYSLIEACIDPNEGRQIDIRGVFRDEIDAAQGLLRRSRNAVFHVPRVGHPYDDARMMALVTDENTGVLRIRRIHQGFGRLFSEELSAR
jgi:hypothetical protein